MKFNKIALLLPISIQLLFIGCGEPGIDLNDVDYQPKIVVEAMIYPEKNIDDIKISRNIPLNVDTVYKKQLFISNAEVFISSENTKEYKLSYNFSKQVYYLSGDSIKIEYGKKYKIRIQATIDGRILSTSAETTTPMKGFQIIKANSTQNSASLQYSVSDNPTIAIKPSPYTTFYAITNESLQTMKENFIVNNLMNIKYGDIEDNLTPYVYNYSFLENINPLASFVKQKIEWSKVFFTGKNRIVVYATDSNFMNFLLSNQKLQEMDGNYHEPRMTLKDDGIGYFGSALTDTIYYYVNK